MSGYVSWKRMGALLVLGSACFLTLPASGQSPISEDPPRVYLSRPTSPQEQKCRESLYEFVLGVMLERQDRVLEALKAYERAIALDPNAAGAYRAQIPLLLALDRQSEALAASRKVIELIPQDHGVWYLYARQLKELGKTLEARRALQHTLGLFGLKDRPDLTQQIHVDLAGIHEAADEHVPAAEAYVRAAKILEHPEPFLDHGLTPETIAQRAAELYERSGKMYMRGKKYDEATATFRLAQKCDPGGAGRLNLHLAQICLEQNRAADALAHLDGYLRLQPQGAEAYEMKITLLKKLNRETDILPWLEQAGKADPYNQGLKLVTAKAQAHARPAEAEKILLDLAGENPGPDLYVSLFQVYRDANSAGRGLALIDKTVNEAKLRPPIPGRGAQAKAMIIALRQEGSLSKDLVQASLKAGAPELQTDTLLLLAALADHHRLTDESEQLYRRCLKNITPENEALVYGNLLRLLWKSRKVDDVIRLCQEGLKHAKSTNHVIFRHDLAKALARQGKHDEALGEANRALALASDADRFMIRCLRIRLLSLADRLQHAEAECLVMLKESTQPGEILEARYLLSTIYSTARNLPKAEEQLEVILKVDPNNATVCNDLGYIWADQNKNLAEAEALIRKAIELERRQRQAPSIAPPAADHDNAAYIDSLGWVLFRRGQIDAALHELERAARLPDGEDPVIWDHLGDVYYHLQQIANARASWQRALQLYEQQRTRRMDERYRELQRKYKAVEGSK